MSITVDLMLYARLPVCRLTAGRRLGGGRCHGSIMLAVLYG